MSCKSNSSVLENSSKIPKAARLKEIVGRQNLPSFAYLLNRNNLKLKSYYLNALFMYFT